MRVDQRERVVRRQVHRVVLSHLVVRVHPVAPAVLLVLPAPVAAGVRRELAVSITPAWP